MKELAKYKGYYVDEFGNVYKKTSRGTYRKKKVYNGQTTFTVNGKRHTLLVGRLIYETLKGVQLQPTDYVLHKDKDINNNNINNLYVENCYSKLECCVVEQDLLHIKGYSDYYFDEDGKIYHKKQDKYYVIKPDNQGAIRIYQNGEVYHLSAARLIYETLYDKISDDMLIIHRDGNILNNRVDNLKCMSRSASNGVRVTVKFDNKRIIPFSTITSFYNYMVEKYGYKNSIAVLRYQIANNNVKGCTILQSGVNHGTK